MNFTNIKQSVTKVIQRDMALANRRLLRAQTKLTETNVPMEKLKIINRIAKENNYINQCQEDVKSIR